MKLLHKIRWGAGDFSQGVNDLHLETTWEDQLGLVWLQQGEDYLRGLGRHGKCHGGIDLLHRCEQKWVDLFRFREICAARLTQEEAMILDCRVVIDKVPLICSKPCVEIFEYL